MNIATPPWEADLIQLEGGHRAFLIRPRLVVAAPLPPTSKLIIPGQPPQAAVQAIGMVMMYQNEEVTVNHLKVILAAPLMVQALDDLLAVMKTERGETVELPEGVELPTAEDAMGRAADILRALQQAPVFNAPKPPPAAA